jgi:hypothetical protein
VSTARITITLPARERHITLTAPAPLPAYRWLDRESVRAKLDGISDDTLLRWERAGKLTPFRDGRFVRYREDQIDALLNGGVP